MAGIIWLACALSIARIAQVIDGTEVRALANLTADDGVAEKSFFTALATPTFGVSLALVALSSNSIAWVANAWTWKAARAQFRRASVKTVLAQLAMLAEVSNAAVGANVVARCWEGNSVGLERLLQLTRRTEVVRVINQRTRTSFAVVMRSHQSVTVEADFACFTSLTEIGNLK